MKFFKYLLGALAVTMITGCQNNEPKPEIQLERSVNYVSSTEIPSVMNQLNNALGLNNEIKSSSNNGIITASLGQIELEQIMEVIDTLNNANYTFMVNDEDENPYSFSNLIVKKHTEGDFEAPYLLEYLVDSTHMTEFVASGFSMEKFTGSIFKRYLTNIVYNNDNQANLERRSTTNNPGPCDQITYYNQGAGTGPAGPGSDQPTSGGGVFCHEHFEYIRTARHCYKSDVGSGPRCHEHYGMIRIMTCHTNEHTEVNDASDCPPVGNEEIGIIISDAEMADFIVIDYLNGDQNGLMNISCAEIEKWKNIAEHVPNQQVIDKLEFLNAQNNSNLFGIGFDIQTLSGAFGATVNMDNFSVTVTELPNGMTAGQLLEEMRKNLNNFIDTDLSSFRPYDLTPTGTNENALWNSSNPLGSIIHIDIPGDNASVVCSDYANDKWRFSTITSPADYLHPVSGTREFGYERNPDGSYNFYTRGVDRVTIGLGDNDHTGILSLGDILMTKLAFSGADNLWKTFQNGIEGFVNTNGGYAFKNDPILHRPDYQKLERVLNGELPITALGCD